MKKFVLRFRAQDRAIFNALKSGQKRVETRAATERFRRVKVGDKLIFICGQDRFEKEVRAVSHFPSIEAMLHEVGFRQIAPWLNSAEELVSLYQSFPGYPEKIAKFGILAFS